MSPRKPRVVHVTAPTPALYRDFRRWGLGRCVSQRDDGAYIVLDSRRFAELISACHLTVEAAL